VHNEELEDLFEESNPTLQELRDKVRAKTPKLPELQEHRIKVAYKVKTNPGETKSES
jgi:hypothetical protein